MSEPIRVVLVEDNEVFREALELLLGLRPDMSVIASVPDGSKAAGVVAELEPDVVLMDYRLPGLDGVQATRAASRTTRSCCRRSEASLAMLDQIAQRE